MDAPALRGRRRIHSLRRRHRGVSETGNRQAIIHWQDCPQLGYEILPNKYFYRYQPPTPAKELLAEFWKLEKEAEKMLEGLAQ